MKLILDKKRFNLLFVIVGVLYVIFHLLTLDISPLPWFDETFMLNIAKNKIDTGAYLFTIAPPYESGNNEALIYGPLYFIISTTVLKIFGVGIFQYRIVGVFFAFLVLLISYFTARKNSFFLIFLLALDPLFLAASHSGRMDTMALTLGLASLYLFFESEKKNNYWLLIGAGLLSGLTLLTTPRAFVTLFGIGFLLLLNVLRYRTKESILKSIVWGIPVVVLYGIWVIYAFGSVNGLLDYYASFDSAGFVQFFNVRISTIQKPLILVLSVTLIWSIWLKGKAFFNDRNIVYLSSLFIFYLLIFDTGIYSILILPFIYLLIVDNFPSFKFDNRFVFKALLAFNVLFFLIKGTVIFLERGQRNHEKISDFIGLNIPEGANIVGDEMYYYAAIENNSAFQYYHLYKSINGRYAYQRDVFKYEYVILSNRFKGTVIEKLYVEDKCEIIATFKSEKNKTAQMIESFLPIKILNEFDCVIYKLKK